MPNYYLKIIICFVISPFMNVIRKILFPFSILYGWITSLRNYLYDVKVLTSYSFDTPTIVVGNLSVGGTGKTPQIEYLIRLLQNRFKVAVLSRGYKRKSEGFILADSSVNASLIGDEPFQYYQKFPKIKVAVDADRVNGIEQLEQLKNMPEVILLDDAFQHRKVTAGFNILLTSYDHLFVKDFMLPTGNLRENRKGAKRAQVIIVTKCPANLSDDVQRKIHKKLKPTMFQRVFFTTINYDAELKGENSLIIDDLIEKEVVLITGIANPKPLTSFLSTKNIKFKHLKYPDHYNFSEKDIKEIIQLQGNNKLLLTTEKDYVRLYPKIKNLFYISIETQFLNHKNDFDILINKYVEQSTGNS